MNPNNAKKSKSHLLFGHHFLNLPFLLSFILKTELLKLFTEISSNSHKGKINKINFNVKHIFLEGEYEDFQCM